MVAKKKTARASRAFPVNQRSLHLVCAIAGCTERTARRVLVEKHARNWAAGKRVAAAVERILATEELWDIASEGAELDA